MTAHDDVLDMVAYLLNDPDKESEQKLHECLRLLGKYRSQLLANELIARSGTQVRSGPFAGMVLPESVAEGCFVPKLLGCYEQDLHGIVRSFPSRGYDAVVNIGCAEGYYAVGLARLIGNATIAAHDTDPEARRLCAELAERNGVRDRLVIGETFHLADFARYQGKRTCVVCDIEGAEGELLDPERAPALREMDVLVEVHDCFRPGTTEKLRARFDGTHAIESIPFVARDAASAPELAGLDNLDQLLSVWEWRLPGNDWLWLEAKR